MEPRPWHRHYDPGIPATITFAEKTLSRLLADAARGYPDRDAIRFQNARLTFSRLHDEVRRLATAFSGMGAQPGDRIAIMLPNIPQCVIAFYAALEIGAVPAMTNPLYVPREIEYQWNDCGATIAVVGDWTYEQKVKGIRDRLPVKHYVVASVAEYLRFPLNLLAPFKLRRMSPPMAARVVPGPGIYSFRRLIESTPPNPPPVNISMDDVAVLLYTGGTTGVSKGAMLTQRNLSCNVQQLIAWFHQPLGQEVQLAALPIFHSFGMTVCMAFPLSIAATLVLVPNPRDIKSVLQAIVKHRVTLAPQVPAMFNAVTQFSGVEKLDLRSIKICNSGSAPLSVDVLERYEKLTGAKICEGYGLTETSPVTHCNPVESMRKVGAIGVPLPSTDARVVDTDEGTRDLPAGEPGELILRGPQVMKGYWNKPEETANSIRNGWFHTGDLATMDADGYFRIVGRKKDMIIASGFKVFPDEVDRVLMAHASVLEAATIGVPDAKKGESVKSFVVLRPGMSASAGELAEHCRAELAPFKVPKEIEFRTELPKSAVLKILRRELRDEELKRRDEGKGKRET
ncbi:MAG: long-chain fatty acid--CoA ligase [Gemmatimonadetes bacterium]|nr:long-chain fatty acid--CoA ligase [Gemmatimonadota bacterium]